MESNLSCLSSLKEENNSFYVQPHYKETYRLAIYALLCGGKEAYEEFLRAEQISHFLSEEEIFFILGNAELPVVEDSPEARRVPDEVGPSTYFPMESDEEVPDLDLGWPELSLEGTDTSISLLFHPPRQNTPTIKEVVRKQIQEARQVIAIAMDVFTDVDVFKEIISASLRGVAVYILLDESQFRSFHTMSRRVGVDIQDLKNMRVRTVQGQLYQCQSGMKFHGGLEQKFTLFDCRTVLYGTYSYTWSYEKINLSMVMVVTGQLVCSYDEEFRRLYARSTVPAVLSRERPSVQYRRDNVELQRPSSSQLSLQQIHMKSRAMHGMRNAQDARFYDATILTRGLSVQEKLHQSHCPDMGNLVRGHSYGGELQKVNSMTRLRMGTKNIGVPLPPERTGSNLRGHGDFLQANRLQKQQLRHQTQYGADQNMIPFNSETSLHKWKMDTYLNENGMPVDACDSVSPMISPYSSHTGLNDYQSQVIHNRSRDIKSRMEERQKRLSLQEYLNLKQSQESLRSMYASFERPKHMSSLRGQDMRQGVAELEKNAQSGWSLEPVNNKGTEPSKVSNKKEQNTTDGQQSASHYDVKMVADQKHDRHESLSRTSLAVDSDMKLNDPSLKRSHLQSSNLSIHHPRAMESLTEVPEEKESSNMHFNNLDSTSLNNINREVCKDDKRVPKEKSVKLSLPAESQHRDRARGSPASIGKVNNNLGSAAQREGIISVSSDAEKTLKTSAGSLHAVEAETGHTEKQQEGPGLQRKNSTRMKVHALLSLDEKKASKKERSLQRKASIGSQNPSGSNQTVGEDHAQASVNGLPSESQTSVSGHADTEKPKSPFSRLSSHRSSKRKTNPAAEQDQGPRSTVSSEGTTVTQTRPEKAYSPYEILLNTDRSSSLKRHDSGFPMHQTEGGTDNKLGRFMQRMGNLIGKNK